MSQKWWQIPKEGELSLATKGVFIHKLNGCFWKTSNLEAERGKEKLSEQSQPTLQKVLEQSNPR